MVPVDTDFRFALRTILAFEDPELTDLEKQSVMLGNLYYEVPEDVPAACVAALAFLNGSLPDAPNEHDLRTYAFSKDAVFVFSAFRQTHGVDLSTVKMHWWVFQALFMDLGSETTFVSLVGLRNRVNNSKASKEEIELARSLGELFTVETATGPRDIEGERRVDEFFAVLGTGRKQNG